MHKINNLQNKINDLQTKNENNLIMMKNNNNLDIKQLSTEKDFEINYLNNNNKELEGINDELKNQLHKNMNEYTKYQYNYNDILTTLKFTLKNLQKENIDIKEYYESKINFLIDNFNIEKKKIINSYELNIDKLNNEYNISKDKYQNYLKKRNNDINNISEENKNEVNKLNEKLKNLEMELNELKN